MDSFSSSSSSQEITEPFDEKINLFDQLLKYNKTEEFKIRLSKWIDANEDDKDVFLLEKALKHINNPKKKYWDELQERIKELKTPIEDPNQQINLLKKNLIELEKNRQDILNERIYVENLAAYERQESERAGDPVPSSSEKTQKRLANADRALEIIEDDIYNIRMQILKAKKGIGCQSCDKPAKFVCSVYYCGEACQKKHLK